MQKYIYYYDENTGDFLHMRTSNNYEIDTTDQTVYVSNTKINMETKKLDLETMQIIDREPLEPVSLPVFE